MYDMTPHLARQAAFSRATFGPGPRTKGVIQHVRKELVEVEKVYEENEGRPTHSPFGSVHEDAASEWTDVAILGLDGLLRAIWAAHPDWTSTEVADHAVGHIAAKQAKNERRDWPDWRTMSPEQAIEHVRGKED